MDDEGPSGSCHSKKTGWSYEFCMEPSLPFPLLSTTSPEGSVAYELSSLNLNQRASLLEAGKRYLMAWKSEFARSIENIASVSTRS